MAVGNYEEALGLYKSVLTGLYVYDPDLLFNYAKAAYLAHKPKLCIELLDRLKTHNPGYNSPEGHLYYAKYLAAINDVSAAKREFEVLIKYYSGFEAKVSYAEALIAFQEPDAAKELLEELIMFAKRSKAHVRELNKAALKRAKTLLNSLP